MSRCSSVASRRLIVVDKDPAHSLSPWPGFQSELACFDRQNLLASKAGLRASASSNGSCRDISSHLVGRSESGASQHARTDQSNAERA